MRMRGFPVGGFLVTISILIVARIGCASEIPEQASGPSTESAAVALNFDIAAAMEESASYREVCEFLDDYLASQTPEYREAVKTICLAIGRCTGPELAKVRFGRMPSPTMPPEADEGRYVPLASYSVPGEQWRMSITQPGESDYPDGAANAIVLGGSGVIGLHFTMESAIDSCPCLTSIDPVFLNDDFLRYVGRLTTLEYLDLGGGKITDAGMSHLRGLHGLRELTLNGEGRFISQLNVGNCHRVTVAGIAMLDELRQLERLEFSYASPQQYGRGGGVSEGATGEGNADAGGDGTDSREASRAFFRLIAQNPQLRQLSTSPVVMDSADAAILAGCSQLESLTLWGIPEGGVVPELQNLPKLRECLLTLEVRDGSDLTLDFIGWPTLQEFSYNILSGSPESAMSLNIQDMPDLSQLNGRIISDGAVVVDISGNAKMDHCVLAVSRRPDTPPIGWDSLYITSVRNPDDASIGPPPIVRVHDMPELLDLNISYNSNGTGTEPSGDTADVGFCIRNVPKLREATCMAIHGTLRLEMDTWPCDHFATGNLVEGSVFPEGDAPWKKSRYENVYPGLTWNGETGNGVFPDLVRHATGLEWLWLTDVDLTKDTVEIAGMFDAIAQIPSLQKITFRRCTLTPEIVTRISQHPTLSQIEVRASSIPDRWENLPNIENIKIDYDYGPSKDEHPETLLVADAPKLRGIYVYSQGLRTVTFRGCPSLEASGLMIQGRQISLIDLRGTNVLRGSHIGFTNQYVDILYPDHPEEAASGKSDASW